MKNQLTNTFQKWKNHIIHNRKSWFYDVGVLLFGTGFTGEFVFFNYWISALAIVSGGALIIFSDKKTVTKILTILLMPFAVVILFFLMIFSGGNLFVIISLVVLFTFPLLCRILLWINKKPKEINWALSFLGILILAKIIHFAFFTEMEVIQSKVYKNMYFIKNPVSNTDSIRSSIKKMCLQRMNKEFISNEKKYKDYNNDSSKVWLNYDLNFYNYTDNWLGSNTAHFIENEEDDGGPTSMHFLSEIQNEKMARFSINYCENDTVNYYATLTYYQGEREIKTDTLINQCPKKIVPEQMQKREEITSYGSGGTSRRNPYPTENETEVKK